MERSAWEQSSSVRSFDVDANACVCVCVCDCVCVSYAVSPCASIDPIVYPRTRIKQKTKCVERAWSISPKAADRRLALVN